MPRVPPILTNWLGEDAVADGRRKFRGRAFRLINRRADAIKGFSISGNTLRRKKALMRTPPQRDGPTGIDREAARTVMRAAARARTLDAQRARGQGGACGLRHSHVPTSVAALAGGGRADRASLLKHDAAVAVKMLSEDISHKSDVGGVRLGLASAAEARAAAETMATRVAKARPDARLQGFTVQPMIVWPNAHELLLGVSEDRLFGPVILFGAGGTATEIIKDTPLRFRRSMSSLRAI